MFGIVFIVAYYAVLLLCIGLCLRNAVRARTSKSKQLSSAYFALYLLLAGVALLVTWRYMILFFWNDWDLWKSERTAQKLPSDFWTWVDEGERFKNSYVIVTRQGALWYASQLILWVNAFVSMLHVEGSRQNVKHLWAYITLGLLGAMSVALPLFLMQIPHADNRMQNSNSSIPGVRWSAVASLILAFMSTIVCPYTPYDYFGFNVAFGHLIILVPVFWLPSNLAAKGKELVNSFGIVALYVAVAASNFAAFALSTLAYANQHGQRSGKPIEGLLGIVIAQSENIHALYGELWKADAITSIGFDLIFTTFICSVFILIQGRSFWIPLLLAFLCPIVSVSCAFPLFLGWRESLRWTSKHKGS